MATISKWLNISPVGSDVTTVNIKDDQGNILASGVSRATLLNGVLITFLDTATKIIVEAEGLCAGFKSELTLIPETTTTTTTQPGECSTWAVANNTENNGRYSYFDCQVPAVKHTIMLNAGASAEVCSKTGVDDVDLVGLSISNTFFACGTLPV
jgi:hypothetical protein